MEHSKEQSFEEQQKLDRIRKKVKSIKGFYRHLVVYLVINSVLIILTAVNMDADQEFFRFHTFSTAFYWGIGLVFHAWGVFGTDIFLGTNWEDRKIKEMMDRDKDRKTKWE